MKRRIMLLSAILIWFNISISAQSRVLWGKQLGNKGWDYVNAMIKSADGNFVLGGSLNGVMTEDSLNAHLRNSNNAFLASCDTNGNILWQKNFGGILFDNVTCLSNFLDGKILVSGIFQDTLRCDSLKIFSTSFSSAYTALIDTAGKMIWLNPYGGYAKISQVLNCSNTENVAFIAGVFSDSLQLNEISFSKHSEKGFFISRLSNDGLPYNPFVIKASGSCKIEGISCGDSTLYLTGSFSDSLYFGDTIISSIGEENIFIARYSFDGVLQKVFIAYGPGNSEARSICLAPSGDLCLTGWFDNSILLNENILLSNGGKDLFVAQFDSAFNVKWVRNIGGLGDDFGYFTSLNKKNEVFVSGSFVHFMQFPDANGNPEFLDASNAFGNAFIAKFDIYGNLMASYNLPATSEDFCKSILADTNGVIMAAGNFFQKMLLTSFESEIDSIVSAGDRDIFLFRLLDNCKTFSINAGLDTIICPGQVIPLAPENNYTYFRWLPFGLPNQTYFADSPGEYTLFVTSEHGCIATDTIVISSMNSPEIFAGNDTTIAAGNSISLDMSNSSNIIQSEWSTTGSGYFSNSYTLNTTYNPSNEDISSGVILLTLSGYNQCGSSSDSLALTIDQESDGITAFPNPSSGPVNFVCEDGITILTVSISTQAGNIIQNPIVVNSFFLQYDLSSYPPGAYVFHFLTSNSSVTKIINKL